MQAVSFLLVSKLLSQRVTIIILVPTYRYLVHLHLQKLGVFRQISWFEFVLTISCFNSHSSSEASLNIRLLGIKQFINF